MAYTCFSKKNKQTNKGNTTTHPQPHPITIYFTDIRERGSDSLFRDDQGNFDFACTSMRLPNTPSIWKKP